MSCQCMPVKGPAAVITSPTEKCAALVNLTPLTTVDREHGIGCLALLAALSSIGLLVLK